MQFEFREGTTVLLGMTLTLVAELPAFGANPERD